MAHGNQGSALAPPRESELKRLLATQMTRMKALLGAEIRPEQMCALAMESVRKTPLLAECTPETLVYSVLQACIGNLRIGGPFPEAHLVPFRNNKTNRMECQLIVDYRGVIKAICRTGLVTKVQPRSVYEGDHFRVRYGTDEGIEHEPCLDPKQRGHLTHVYAVIYLDGGDKKFEVMNTEEIDGIRARSKAGQNGPWVTDYEAMAWKTVIKRAAKTVPLPEETRKAIDADEIEPEEKQADFEVRDTLPAARGRQQADAREDYTDQAQDEGQQDDDPQRAELLRTLSDLEVDHGEIYAEHFKGAPPLSDLSTEDLASSARFIARKVEQTAKGGA